MSQRLVHPDCSHKINAFTFLQMFPNLIPTSWSNVRTVFEHIVSMRCEASSHRTWSTALVKKGCSRLQQRNCSILRPQKDAPLRHHLGNRPSLVMCSNDKSCHKATYTPALMCPRPYPIASRRHHLFIGQYQITKGGFV